MDTRIPISTFSRLTQLTQKALRLYDRKGILIPCFKEITGYRYYSFDQIDTAIKIRTLANLDFGLADIKKIMKTKNAAKIKRLFEKQILRTQDSINKLKSAQKILLKKDLNEVFTMNSEKPIIKELPETRVISKRVKGKYKEDIDRLTNGLMAVIGKNNAKIIGPITLLCYDDDYKEKDADFEVAIPVSGSIEKGDYEIKKLPAEKVVSLVHKGHPSDMDEFMKSYKEVYRFAAENNLTLKLPDRLLFLTSMDKVAKEDTVSEIQYTIKSK
ncbi:MAG: MerR family transcriptional regulator [Nanoarchaeota archaeon]|nr:MerR family transcriptional regulator [Nanoarchaeota archaeon]